MKKKKENKKYKIIIYDDEELKYYVGECEKPLRTRDFELGVPTNSFEFSVKIDNLRYAKIELDEELMKRISAFNKTTELKIFEKKIQHARDTLYDVENNLYNLKRMYKMIKFYILLLLVVLFFAIAIMLLIA